VFLLENSPITIFQQQKYINTQFITTNLPTSEGEMNEMIEIYKERGGMSQEDAELVIRTMAKYKDFFVDMMMTQELELQVPEENHVQESMKEGVVMFCSFAFFGAMPLLGYVIIPVLYPDLGTDQLFTTACVVTGIVLFIMGCIKSFFWYVKTMQF